MILICVAFDLIQRNKYKYFVAESKVQVAVFFESLT